MTNKINQDDINKAVWTDCDDFLNHLSGDEGTLQSLHVSEFFLSHLSGDEELKTTTLTTHKFLSHFLHYPTMRKVVDIGTFRMQNSL